MTHDPGETATPAEPVRDAREVIARQLTENDLWEKAPQNLRAVYLGDADDILTALAAAGLAVVPAGEADQHAANMRGYEVACRFGVMERRAFELVDAMRAALSPQAGSKGK